MILRRQLISRSEAIAAGLTRYFTGKPCPKGHVAERMTCNQSCYICLKLRSKATQVERGRQYGRRHPDRVKRLTKKWRTNNQDKIRGWRANNSEKIRVYHATRRALKENAAGFHAADDIQALLIKQSHTCCGPGCSFDLRRGYHVDHKNPLSRGGSNWPCNLQVLCGPCNSKKGTKTNREWRRTRVTSSTV